MRPMADDFARQRMQMQDRIVHDGGLTASTRLVGIEILGHLNRVTGDAWPSEMRIATRLGLNIRTVRRGLNELEQAGYLVIERRESAVHHYRFRFEALTPAKLAAVQGVGTPAKKSMDPGQKVQTTPAKKCPLTPLSTNPLISPSTSAAKKNDDDEEKRSEAKYGAGFEYAKWRASRKARQNGSRPKTRERPEVVAHRVALRLGEGHVAKGWELLGALPADTQHDLVERERAGKLNDAAVASARLQVMVA